MDGIGGSSEPVASQQVVATYGYDAVGNMTSISDGLGGVGNPTYATGNRVTSWPGGWTFEYDKDGNRTKRKKGTDSTLFFWSADGRLDSLTSGSRTIRYDYNAGGQLVRKRANATVDRHFLWDGGHLLAELDASDTLRVEEYAHYPGVDRPLALVTGGTTIAQTRFYRQDALGNVIGLLDTNGGVDAVESTRGTWGTLQVPASGGQTGRLGWKGLPYEGDSTQLYYVRARWYDPRTTRFMSEDPIGLRGGINSYVFALNDPVNGSDPTGLKEYRGPCSILAECGRNPLEGLPDVGGGATGGGHLDPGAVAGYSVDCKKYPQVCAELLNVLGLMLVARATEGYAQRNALPLGSVPEGAFQTIRGYQVLALKTTSFGIEVTSVGDVTINMKGAVRVKVDGPTVPDPIITRATLNVRTGQVQVQGYLNVPLGSVTSRLDAGAELLSGFGAWKACVFGVFCTGSSFSMQPLWY